MNDIRKASCEIAWKCTCLTYKEIVYPIKRHCIGKDEYKTRIAELEADVKNWKAAQSEAANEVFRLREHLTKIANFAIRHEGCGCFYEMAMDALAKPPSVEGERCLGA